MCGNQLDLCWFEPILDMGMHHNLVEIMGGFKVEPLGNIDMEVINNLGLSNLGSMGCSNVMLSCFASWKARKFPL
ncbi:hypothetical protein ACSBR1_004068 [Camellia fascicularis]